jgi:hypothetical protein
MQVVGNAVELISGWDNAAVVQGYYERGAAFTALNAAGEIVGCAGIQQVSEGIGNAWAIADKDKILSVSPARIYATIREYIPTLMKQYGFRRVQADCVVGIPLLEHFIMEIGFVKEGVLRRVGKNGEDHILFSLIEGDIQDTP